MADLVWTKTPPTQPGWYFWRWRKGAMRVFHVAPRKKGLGYGVCKGSASCIVHDDDDEEWAGPFPEPIEAKEAGA